MLCLRPGSRDRRGWVSLWSSGLPNLALPAGGAPVFSLGFSCHSGCGGWGEACERDKPGTLSTKLKVRGWRDDRTN